LVLSGWAFGLAVPLAAEGRYGEPPLEVDKGAFLSWLLMRDTDVGRKGWLEFKDCANRNRRFRKQSPQLALAIIDRIGQDQVT
jgi:hypothetical protein